MRLFMNWFLYVVAILITAYILPGVSVGGPVSVIILSVVLGAINMTLRPLLVLLTLPLSVFTLGIFVLIINAFLVLLAESIVPGFQVEGFGWAFLFAIILSIISTILSKIEKEAEGGMEV